MRQGQNPAKMGLKAYQPAQLGILLLTYIPTQTGYFSDSLKVLEYQVASIHKNTPVQFNLHIFDNGSCREVREALSKMQTDGWVDWLTLSEHNMGKPGALNWALRGMPNEIICYSDGDVYFRQGWYEASLKVLEIFPRTGMVTAQPCFFDNMNGKGRAHLGLRTQEEFLFPSRPAVAWITEEYVRSVGNNPDLQTKYQQHTWQVIREQASGLEAVVGASPFQFLAYKTRLEKILPLTYIYTMREDAQIAARMDNLGLLQLSTLQPFVYHIGNRLDEVIMVEIQRDRLDESLQKKAGRSLSFSQNQASPAKKRALQALHSIARIPLFKRIFRRAYNLLFEYFIS